MSKAQSRSSSLTPFAPLVLDSRFVMGFRGMLLGLVLGLSIEFATAEDFAGSFTLNLPLTPTVTLPSWIALPPDGGSDTLSSFSATFSPFDSSSDLSVTIYFNESNGGFLRVLAKSDQAAQTISENLLEGIGMPNQRTLIIPHKLFTGPTTLTVQSTEKELNVTRIHFEWTHPQIVSVGDGGSAPAVILQSGKTADLDEITGDPQLPANDSWKGNIITATLWDKPTRIEDGVEFAASFQSAPAWVKLDGEFSGIPLGKSISVWVDGVRQNEVSVIVPDFSDPGYELDDQGTPWYAGWRHGSVYITGQAFSSGENLFQFSWSDGTPFSAAVPIATKNLSLQIKYPEPVATPAPVASSNSLSLIHSDSLSLRPALN